MLDLFKNIEALLHLNLQFLSSDFLQIDDYFANNFLYFKTVIESVISWAMSGDFDYLKMLVSMKLSHDYPRY